MKSRNYFLFFFLTLSAVVFSSSLPESELVQQLRMNSVNIGDAIQPRQNAGSYRQLKRYAGRDRDTTYKILLDPGHGGKDNGAVGLFGVTEKELSLRIGKLVRREIERYFKAFPTDRGVEVEMTREDDTFIPLSERVNTSNAWNADLFVSIHANSSPFKKARGFEIYFLDSEATDAEATKLARIENAEHEAPLKNAVFSILSDVQATHHVSESSQFAETVFSTMATKAVCQARSVRQGPFTVLHGTTMPAILIEVGYVTNPDDAKNFTKESYLKRLALAISSGIIDFAVKKKKLI